MLQDIDNWDKKKEDEHNKIVAEKERILEEERQRQALIDAEEEKARQAERESLSSKKRKTRRRKGDEDDSADNQDDDDNLSREEIKESEANKTIEKDLDAASVGDREEGEGDNDDPATAAEKKYKALLKQLEAENAESEDEFTLLEIKGKIREYEK